MVFAACVAEVVIAAPDDADRIHIAIGQALNWWNAASGQRHEIVLVPSEGHGIAAEWRLNPSALTAHPADRGDVFITVIEPMRRNVAQVLGDVDRAKRAGRLVLVWLLAESPSDGLTADDRAWLGDLTQRLSRAGVIPRYLGKEDAHFESRLRTAIYTDLTHRNLRILASAFEKSSPASGLRIYRTPVALLGPQIWAVTVMNHSTSLVVGLQVSVGAVDSEGHARTGGAKRSSQRIADVFAKLKAGPWPDAHHPLSDPRGFLPAQPPTFLSSRIELLAAHNAVNFPRWLRPNQHASALYSLEPNAAPQVRIRFEDEAGDVWSRTNDAEPQRVSIRASSFAGPRLAGITGE